MFSEIWKTVLDKLWAIGFGVIGFLIAVIVAISLSSCGMTAKGADGSNGVNGNDGRSYLTPVVRPYNWDTTGTVLSFQDAISTKNIQLSSIGFALDGGNNYLWLRVPAGNIGKKLRVVVNGNLSTELIVPSNGFENILFFTAAGTDSSTERYMDCSKLNQSDRSSYLAWFLDGIQQEMYFSDSFK